MTVPEFEYLEKLDKPRTELPSRVRVDLFIAWDRGHKIQAKLDGVWTDLSNPPWFGHVHYRKAPGQ